MIKKYTLAGVVFEAVQWLGNNLDEIISFCGQDKIGPIERRPDYILRIETEKGLWSVSHGGFIVKNHKGKLSIYGPKEFDSTFSAIKEVKESLVLDTETPTLTEIKKVLYWFQKQCNTKRNCEGCCLRDDKIPCLLRQAPRYYNPEYIEDLLTTEP